MAADTHHTQTLILGSSWQILIAELDYIRASHIALVLRLYQDFVRTFQDCFGLVQTRQEQS